MKGGRDFDQKSLSVKGRWCMKALNLIIVLS